MHSLEQTCSTEDIPQGVILRAKQRKRRHRLIVDFACRIVEKKPKKPTVLWAPSRLLAKMVLASCCCPTGRLIIHLLHHQAPRHVLIDCDLCFRKRRGSKRKADTQTAARLHRAAQPGKSRRQDCNRHQCNAHCRTRDVLCLLASKSFFLQPIIQQAAALGSHLPFIRLRPSFPAHPKLSCAPIRRKRILELCRQRITTTLTTCPQDSSAVLHARPTRQHPSDSTTCSQHPTKVPSKVE